MNVPGIDVSNYQHAPDWATVAAAGIRYAWVLATDGSDFLDKYYPDDVTGARDNGIKVGGYHFARPNRHDAITEARWYRANVPSELDLPTALDMERNWLPSIQANTDWAMQFLDLIGSDPLVLYTNGDGADKHLDSARLVAEGVELWYANPGAVDLSGVGHWDRASAVQYGVGPIPGIDADVDLDRMPEEILLRWTSSFGLPNEEDEKLLHIIKGDMTPQWWVTDFVSKRYIPTADDANVIIFVTVQNGGKISHDANNGPNVVPQSSVDAIPVADHHR